MRALEHEQRLAARERETLEGAQTRMHQREELLKQREETFRRKLGEELEAQVRQARREIDEVIAGLKEKTNAIAQEASRQAVSTGATGAARSDARAAVESVAQKFLEPVAAAPQHPAANAASAGRQPSVGDRVIVGGFGLEGVVTSIHEETAEVDVRGKRMRAGVRDLQLIGSAPAAPAKVRVNVDLQPRDAAAVDLNVIGCTVDEALSRAERFLDESLLTDQRTIRVIHGYGTGQLKRALTGFLQQHPLVASIASAPPEQGGGGVTVVELKD
jgi:DNA mismatch repair protein MutS2